MLGFPNIQSLKLGHLILQSVTVWPALLMNPTGGSRKFQKIL